MRTAPVLENMVPVLGNTDPVLENMAPVLENMGAVLAIINHQSASAPSPLPPNWIKGIKGVIKKGMPGPAAAHGLILLPSTTQIPKKHLNLTL